MKSSVQEITGKPPKSTLKKRSHSILSLVEKKLWLQIIIALFAGAAIGVFFGPDAGLFNSETSKIATNWLALPGNLFLQVIKMVVIPLIFSSVIVGILSSGSPKFLKKIGLRLALYFIVTTTIAVTIGFGAATLIQPGSHVELQTQIQAEAFEAEPITMANLPSKIVNVIPGNPFHSFVTGDMLSIVIFSIIFALGLLFTTKKHFEPTFNLLETIQDVTMHVIKWIMVIVPLAVFGLTAQAVATLGLKALAGLGLYVLAVLLGLSAMLGVYAFIIFCCTKKKPRDFFRKIKDSQLLAFSTSSSAAAMPVSLKIAEDKLRVRRSISQFIIPVGATINMDGTALYQAVATVFLAQVFGVHLSFMSLLLILAVTVGSSIGAPSVPGVGVIILASILASVGIPAAGIALIIGVDRILDMCRTSVNVTGDLTACVFFDKNMNKYFEEQKAIADQFKGE